MGDFTKHPTNTLGIPKYQNDVPEGSRLDLCSPNWCDKTTWYEESIRIEDEVLTDLGDGLTFDSVNIDWIDLTHGKVFQEFKLCETYCPVITVDDVVQDESNLDSPEGDFTIDYAAGTITFSEVVTGTVKATYSHENGSRWTIAPTPGKILRLTHVEIQYSDDIVFKDTVQFKVWIQPPGAPAPIMVALTEYKTMMDFILASSVSHPTILKVGGAAPRGMLDNVNLLRWPYTERGSTDLKSSLGMFCTSEGKADTPFDGSYFVVTIFGLSEDEV